MSIPPVEKILQKRCEPDSTEAFSPENEPPQKVQKIFEDSFDENSSTDEEINEPAYKILKKIVLFKTIDAHKIKKIDEKILQVIGIHFFSFDEDQKAYQFMDEFHPFFDPFNLNFLLSDEKMESIQLLSEKIHFKLEEKLYTYEISDKNLENMLLFSSYINSSNLLKNCFDYIGSKIDAIINFSNDKHFYLTITNLKDSNDLSFIKNLRNLHQLSLMYCPKLKNIDYLILLHESMYFKSLQILDCYKIIDLGPLKFLTSLENLQINDIGPIHDYSFLLNFNELKYLEINQFNLIENLSCFENLNKLEDLHLSDCNILNNINSLNKITTLKRITFHNLDVLEDLSSLENLTQLEQLTISRGKALSRFPSLMRLSNLKLVTFSDEMPRKFKIKTLLSIINYNSSDYLNESKYISERLNLSERDYNLISPLLRSFSFISEIPEIEKKELYLETFSNYVLLNNEKMRNRIKIINKLFPLNLKETLELYHNIFGDFTTNISLKKAIKEKTVIYDIINKKLKAPTLSQYLILKGLHFEFQDNFEIINIIRSLNDIFTKTNSPDFAYILFSLKITFGKPCNLKLRCESLEKKISNDLFLETKIKEFIKTDLGKFFILKNRFIFASFLPTMKQCIVDVFPEEVIGNEKYYPLMAFLKWYGRVSTLVIECTPYHPQFEPFVTLDKIVNLFKKSPACPILFNYRTSFAIDHKGITRDFYTRLFASLSNQLSLKKTIPIYEESKEEIFRQIGFLLNHLLQKSLDRDGNWIDQFTIGEIFRSDFFKGLLEFRYEELKNAFTYNEERAFEMISNFTTNEVDQEFGFMAALLKINPSSSQEAEIADIIKKLEYLYAVDVLDPDTQLPSDMRFADNKLEPRESILNNLTFFQKIIKTNYLEKKSNQLKALHAIASGFECKECTWVLYQRMGANAIQLIIQGEFTREKLKEAFQFKDINDSLKQTFLSWVDESTSWIDDSTRDDALKQFLIYISGSPSIPYQGIKVFGHGNAIRVSTCFIHMYVPPEISIKTLKEKLDEMCDPANITFELE